MAALSVFLKSSRVFTFLMMPSALMAAKGELGSLVLSWSDPNAQKNKEDTYVLLVRAFPRICMRQLDSGSSYRGSYRPRTLRAESSSLSWSSFEAKRAE